jgi:hypothetical protein
MACDKVHCFTRFADRDMIMRYHWGLAVGHIYGHQQSRHMHHINSTSFDAEEKAAQSEADVDGNNTEEAVVEQDDEDTSSYDDGSSDDDDGDGDGDDDDDEMLEMYE